MFCFSDSDKELQRRSGYKLFCLFKNLIYNYAFILQRSATENLDILPICRKVWVQKHRYKLKHRSLWGGGIFKIALSSNILKISYIRYCKTYSHARSIDLNSNTEQSTDIRLAVLKTMIRLWVPTRLSNEYRGLCPRGRLTAHCRGATLPVP